MQCVVCYTPQQNLKKEDSRWMKIVQVFFSYLSHHHSRRMSSLNWSLHFGDLSEKDHVYFGHLYLLLQTLMWIWSPWLIRFFVVFGKPLVLGWCSKTEVLLLFCLITFCVHAHDAVSNIFSSEFCNIKNKNVKNILICTITSLWLQTNGVYRFSCAPALDLSNKILI